MPPAARPEYFDVKKLSEEHWLLLKTGDDGYLYLTRYNAAFGTATAVYNTPITAGADAKATYCSVAQHPLTGEVAVVWADDYCPRYVAQPHHRLLRCRRRLGRRRGSH
jgi:hypothetical protein